MPNIKDHGHRISFFATPDENNQLEYFVSAHKDRWQTKADFVRAAVIDYIAHLNGDYDLPTLEIQRLNQLIDTITTLSSNVGSLQDITVNGFGSLLELTRGSNYLVNYDDDGEIN